MWQTGSQRCDPSNMSKAFVQNAYEPKAFDYVKAFKDAKACKDAKAFNYRTSTTSPLAAGSAP